MKTIKARHPVREAFSGRSTGNARGSGRTGYYPSKGHAVNAFDAELQTFDLCLDRNDLADFHGNEGRKVVEVHDEFDQRISGPCGRGRQNRCHWRKRNKWRKRKTPKWRDCNDGSD